MRQLFAILLGLSLMVSCASLPVSSPPRVVDTFAQKSQEPDVPAPTPDQEPDLLVRDFIKANALPESRHAAARQFLTPMAAASWKDNDSMTVVRRVDLNSTGDRTEDRVSYVFRAAKVGEIDPGGIYTPQEGELSETITLKKNDGQWRISSLPQGVIVERAEFFSNYSSHDLYFLSPRGDRLVPDPRWTSSYTKDLPFGLINLISEGPRGAIGGAAKSLIPTKSSVLPIPDDSGPGIGLNFQGLPSMSTEAIKQLAAQVVWTLAAAEIPGPYRLERDDAPLDDSKPEGWTVEDVTDFIPRSATKEFNAAILPAGGVVAVGTEDFVPAAKWGQIDDPKMVSTSSAGQAMALVSGYGGDLVPDSVGNTISIGRTDTGPLRTIKAATIASPTFHPTNGTMWFVENGRIVRRETSILSANEPRSDVVDVSALDEIPGDITTLRIDSSGVRAVMIIGGKIYIATLRGTPGTTPRLDSVQRIGFILGSTALTADWIDRSTVVIGGSSMDAPIVSLSVDGAFLEPLSGRNISPAISLVVADADHVYAVDRNSLVHLALRAEERDRFWRELPGVAGVRAVPVLPG